MVGSELTIFSNIIGAFVTQVYGDLLGSPQCVSFYDYRYHQVIKCVSFYDHHQVVKCVSFYDHHQAVKCVSFYDYQKILKCVSFYYNHHVVKCVSFYCLTTL